jgi:hypothetical protein
MRASLLVASVFVILPRLGLADPTVPQLMGDAQRAYLARDYQTATELFNQVLEIDPHNTLAIQYLRNIHLAQAGMPNVAKDPIKENKLPKIEFKDATFFKEQAAKQGVTVSFVAQLPEPQLEHRVTLSLSNIPFLDALRYLCEQNNAVSTQEPYAIVIKPVPADASPAPAGQ